MAFRPHLTVSLALQVVHTDLKKGFMIGKLYGIYGYGTMG